MIDSTVCLLQVAEYHVEAKKEVYSSIIYGTLLRKDSNKHYVTMIFLAASISIVMQVEVHVIHSFKEFLTKL